MRIETFTQTPFQQNTRVVSCEKTNAAICIDPGERSQAVEGYIRENDLNLAAITLTHGHLDHVGGTSALHAAFPDAEIIIHPDDEELYYALKKQPLFMGIQPEQFAMLGLDYDEPPQVTRSWEDGEIVEVGELRFSVRHCPGHTRGHVVLAEIDAKAVFVGDCLFENSIGRTDLPGGDHEQLLDSIRRNILSLDDDVAVYSGHGPVTTVGLERTNNPFLNGTYQIGSGRYI
ncbi:MAG TPA: MBL fold metallo-hydrolase [Pyrinomonadaceae bacterium]|nr:MBL fold metallo-hydrolase [Pyrinomonadaceae bacterium]